MFRDVFLWTFVVLHDEAESPEHHLSHSTNQGFGAGMLLVVALTSERSSMGDQPKSDVCSNLKLQPP